MNIPVVLMFSCNYSLLIHLWSGLKLLLCSSFVWSFDNLLLDYPPLIALYTCTYTTNEEFYTRERERERERERWSFDNLILDYPPLIALYTCTCTTNEEFHTHE